MITDKVASSRELGSHAMCLAVPARITRLLDDHRAIAEVGGLEKEISIDLVEPVEPGMYVIVHTGFALCRIRETEAKQTLGYFADLARAYEADAGSAATDDPTSENAKR